MRYAVTSAFTSAVVIPPKHINACVAKNIEQTFLMMSKIRVVFLRVMPENIQGTETAVSVPQEVACGKLITS